MTQFSESQLSFGRLRISPAETVELTPSTRPSTKLILRSAKYCWTPPVDLEKGFHPDFSISFEVYQSRDGFRRFLPVGSADQFIDHAFAAGLALLLRDHQLSWEQHSSYRAMKLIFERVRLMQEHHTREFNYSRDLYIRQRGRTTDSERSILPKHLCGSRPAWSLPRLCEEGRVRATTAGVDVMSKRIDISYGLLAAAECNLLHIEDQEQVKGLMRMALFSPAQEDAELTEECIADVYEQLTVLLNKHRKDSDTRFQKWYRGSNNNLLKAIGGRKWSTTIVRKAMLQLGWQSYEYVSRCINYFVQDFLRLLAVPLNAEERKQFWQMYQPQAELGGLPLILLLERHQLIKPVITRLWTNPNDTNAIPVLHQLLAYYAEMVDQRRAADRRSKAHRNHLEVTSSPLAESQSEVSSQRLEDSPVGRIVRVLAENHEWCCEHCNLSPEFSLVDQAPPHSDNAPSFIVEYWCTDHGNRRQIEFSLTELRSIAENLGIEDPG